MGEGNIFSLSTLAGRGVPCSRSVGGGYPIPGLWVWGGTLSQACGWGEPHPRSGWGGTPSQAWVGGYPIPGLCWGYPIPGLGGGLPHPRSGWGYPGYHLARSGWWGYPGYPPGQVWMGGVTPLGQVWMVGATQDTPPPPGLDGVTPPPPIRQSSIASTCYAADGMPLAFTQEDFLVLKEVLPTFSVLTHR